MNSAPVVASLDWLGPTLTAVSLIIAALGSLIGSIVAAWVAIKAKSEATAAKEQTCQTHHAVNGRMSELLHMTAANCAAEVALAAGDTKTAREILALAASKIVPKG